MDPIYTKVGFSFKKKTVKNLIGKIILVRNNKNVRGDTCYNMKFRNLVFLYRY